MIKKLSKSLRFKLTFILMIFMVVSVLVSLIATQFLIKVYFLQDLKTRMEHMYSDVNALFVNNYDEERVKDVLSRITARGDMYVVVIAKDGNVYTNINDESKMWESMQTIVSLLNDDSEENKFGFYGDDGEGYYIFHQNYDGKLNAYFYDLVGTLNDGSLVAIRSSANRFNESLSTTMRLYLYVGFIVIIVGCTAMFFVSNSYVKPISDMAVAAKKMSKLDFDTKVTTNSKDEIGELGESLNSMSRELESTISELKTANTKLMADIQEKTQVDEMRREFLSHVSHELKTPIALIQGYAEGLKENVSDDAESRDFYCEVIMDEADRMNTMVKKLLELNELEFGFDNVRMERFDIAELIRNKNHASEILLKENDINLTFDQDGACYVWSDEFMIEEAYSNYLSNAIHYTPRGGNISVRLEKRNNNIRVNIYNDGSHIPEEDIDKVWIKFYKVDKARTREYGGSGIGLSIVAATMKVLGKDYGVYNLKNGVNFYFELEGEHSDDSNP